MMSPLDFFEDLEKKGGPVNTWDGELYFNAHRGTYTTQAAVKKNNRRSEFALHDLELWGALASLKGKAYPQAEAERLWKQLLLHQFHDILPGSSIARVYVEANEAHRQLQQDAAKLAESARHALVKAGEGITLLNSLGFEREEVIELPEAFAHGAATLEGEHIAVCGGQARVRVPAMGAVTLTPAADGETAPVVTANRIPGGFVMRSDRVELCLDAQAHVVSYKLDGREMTAGRPMNVLRMYKDVPRIFDAWDIDSNYREQPSVTAEAADIKIERAAGLSASIAWEGMIGHSAVRQTITLTAGSPVVTFDTTVDWHELHRLLKVEFPVDVRAENAIHEMQFGFVERPTHRSRGYDQQRFEVCNHHYTALCDNAHGCAVLNDCKYGVGVEENSIELTLLRAAASPEMQSDQGEQHFRYGFTAWEGAFADAPVVRQGLAFNEPIAQESGSLKTFSAFTADRENIVVDTLKPADDGSGDLILRLYESKKADTTFRLMTDLPVAALVPCSMLEEERAEKIAPDAPIHARPFEVKTFRVKMKELS